MTDHRVLGRIVALCTVVVGAVTTPAHAQQVDYTTQIKPLLKERCYACHGSLKQEAGLRLDAGQLIRTGSETGPVVVPGKPDESPLIERIAAEEDYLRMPPEGEPLSGQQIAVFRRWIAEGASSPSDEVPEADPTQHWAFQRPVRPELPRVEETTSGNPIDAFIDARHREAHLRAAPQAEKATLLRRVTLDLIGLPPTREELRDFLADHSPDAYEKAVDRLLQDPRHGERWARHWMDVWRYADWHGRRHVPDVWNSAPQIWRWRDWIVASLNADHGYDRMVREMLAADELCPEDYDATVATGYLVRNWYALNPNDWMRSTVEHTGKAFLGLTFNCAHCHDHKYDPITQEDYFRLRAFFEPMYLRQDREPGQDDPGMFQDYEYGVLRKVEQLGSVRVFDKSPEAPTWFYSGGDERNRDEERGSIAPGVPTLLAELLPPIEPVELPPVAWYPGLRDGIQETMLADAREKIQEAEKQLATARENESEPTPRQQEELAAAQRALTSASEKVGPSRETGALSGQQSLLLDARDGRRILNNSVTDLTRLEEGTAIEYQLALLTPAHFNFQLAGDAIKGRTSAYVAFDNGRIVAYQPGGFIPFDAGTYDFAAGQRRFHVRLVLQLNADQCLLTIRSTSDDAVLVDGVPIALNGWNPVGNPAMGITFDARTGSRAVIDDIRILAPAAAGGSATETPLVTFDFEPPAIAVDTDVVGHEGWTASPFCAGGATSVVAAAIVDDWGLGELAARVEKARRAVRLASLPRLAAEARLEAARAELICLETRIASENASLIEQQPDDALKSQATKSEREAKSLGAKAEMLDKELALASAEAKPDSDADRQKAIDAAHEAYVAAGKSSKTIEQEANKQPDDQGFSPLSPQYPRTSTGRRSALAKWITDRRNPLTARVAVNHVWMRHFHSPLVATVDNFGRSGAAPTHPQLLDWLAVEFMDSGWSMKHLHRLIVTSDAYRRSSQVGTNHANELSIDADNRLLWRMSTGRMEAEVVRDSLLALGGGLDLTMGGQGLENDVSMKTDRRSLYYATYPEQGGKSPLGELFDGPDALGCYRRTRTIVPQQALALTNSDLVHEVSEKLAVRLWEEVADTSASTDPREANREFARTAFAAILSRSPSAAEIDVGLTFFDAATAAVEDQTPADARASFVRALLNHNDFVTIR